MKHRQEKSRGFTLISALFVLVVVSALGVYMVSLGSGQQLSTALSVRSAQAMYAAQSGIEWVLYRLNAGDSCGMLPASLSVEGFTVSIDACAVQSVSEGGGSYPLFDISVTAQFGTYGDFDFVRRRLNAVIMGG